VLLVLPIALQAQEFDPPLITQADRHNFDRTQYRTFQQALGQTNPNAADRAILQEGARQYLYSLTLEELRDNLPDVTEDLVNDLYSTLASENGRRIVCQEIVNLAPNLLPEPGTRLGQPDIVRLNLAIMLRRLNIRTQSAQQAAVPFVPAMTALLKILNDPTSRGDAMYWAADGLGRICDAAQPGVTDGDLGVVQRTEIAEALVAALGTDQAKDDRTRFVTLQIVDSLGDCGLAKNIAGQPVFADALMNVLRNENELDVVRAMAALSLSRLGRVSNQTSLSSGVDFERLFADVMSLTGELANKMRTGPGVHTRRAIVLIYFSFNGEHPLQARQQQTGWNNQIQRNGLGPYRARVESAYQILLPMFQEVLSNENPRISDPMINGIDGWLQDPANVPQGIAAPGNPDPNPN
ncbi:MAG: HEAT repeat domain-containing protein, partial [Thermomicrobiales bacterium]